MSTHVSLRGSTGVTSPRRNPLYPLVFHVPSKMTCPYQLLYLVPKRDILFDSVPNILVVPIVFFPSTFLGVGFLLSGGRRSTFNAYSKMLAL